MINRKKKNKIKKLIIRIAYKIYVSWKILKKNARKKMPRKIVLCVFMCIILRVTLV